MESSESLYKSLQPKAILLVAQAFPGYPAGQLKEMAHDITVDFLFFSKSFSKTFDEARGGLNPFFASYVRKKCMGLWERQLDYPAQIDPTFQDLRTPYEQRFEIKETLLRFVTLLSLQSDKTGIDLERLFMAIIRCILSNGRYSTASVCRVLNMTDTRNVAYGIQIIKRILNCVYHLE